MRKGCAGRLAIAILPQFVAINPHLVRKGCARRFEIAILGQFLAIEPHFVGKLRVAFRAVALAALRAVKGDIEKKERARQESKSARGQKRM